MNPSPRKSPLPPCLRGKSKTLNAAYWLTPAIICLVTHLYCFEAWFRADDFAWLGLANSVHSFPDLLHALFAPAAQGTIRPWSERGFFMLGFTVFGLDSLPFRVVIFATEFAALALVAAVGARLSGWRMAGFWAAIFWSLNSTSAEPLGWACVYNEVMCALFLLLAFYCLLRYIETGLTRWYVWQWIVFLLGFGALELNLVYPVLAASYAVLCARKFLGRTLAMAPVSAVYFVVHNRVAPPPTTGEYAMHYGGPMLHSLTVFWTWSVGPIYGSSPLRLRSWELRAGIVLLTLALVFFLWRKIRERRYAALFAVLWFLIVIGPVLPLSHHLTEYYPFVPAIGICWLGGWAFAEAWHARPAFPRIAATALAAIYAVTVLPETLFAGKWNYDLSQRSRHLVESLASAREHHPGKAIMLYGMDPTLFWNTMRDRSYRLVGLDHLYLPPGTERLAAADPEWNGAEEFAMAGATTAYALEHEELEVYDVRGPRLRNITSIFAATPFERSLPRSIQAGDPLVSELMGPEWYSIETDHRWMPKRATLRLGGPTGPGQHLYLHGYVTEDQLRPGPLTVSAVIDSTPLPPGRVTGREFELLLPIPAALAGKPEIHLTLEVDRTAHPSTDPRDLGLAFGEIAIK